MRRQLLLAQFASTPWAIMPERYSACAAVLQRWASGERAAVDVMEQVEADRQARDARRAATGNSAGGGISVIPVYGVLTQRGNMMDDVSGPGSTSTQMISSALRDALADETVSAILLDIDSPGGSVYGIQELGEEIYQARSKKPVTAIANSLAASAAYWLGSQASELYVTPGGEVGSIGVIASHSDWSKANEMAGVKVTYVTAGKYKSEMNPDEPLSDEAKAYEQDRVNEYYGAFTKAVARGRGVAIASVRDDMGQGRVLGADAAMAVKMVDGIMTFDQVVKRVRSSVKESRGAQLPRAAASLRGVTYFLGRKGLEVLSPSRSASVEQDTPVRLVIDLPRDEKTSLFIQPETVGPEYEFEEAHRRHAFAEGYKYADETTGNTRTFDPKGDYGCNGCNKANGTKCLFVCEDDDPLQAIDIDPVAGSCGYWEDTCAGDPELNNPQKSRTAAVYGVRKGGGPGHVFGCHECPFATDAYAPDSRGRKKFCGKGGFRVAWNACCELNGAETIDAAKPAEKDKAAVQAAHRAARIRIASQG